MRQQVLAYGFSPKPLGLKTANIFPRSSSFSSSEKVLIFDLRYGLPNGTWSPFSTNLQISLRLRREKGSR